ncbi:MAG: hypothetical protein AAFR99_15785 [Cyanobacteria bacterium J06629_9]
MMTTSTEPEDYEKVQQFDIVDCLPKHCVSRDCRELVEILNSVSHNHL